MNPDLVVINHLGALGTGWYGIKTAAIGMVVVFVALAMLIGIIKLIGMFSGTKEKPAPAFAAAPGVASTQPVLAEAEQSAGGGSAAGVIDPQVLAAITAAVYALLEEEKTPWGMIEKQNGLTGRAWSQKGREALMAKRLTL